MSLDEQFEQVRRRIEAVDRQLDDLKGQRAAEDRADARRRAADVASRKRRIAEPKPERISFGGFVGDRRDPESNGERIDRLFREAGAGSALDQSMPAPTAKPDTSARFDERKRRATDRLRAQSEGGTFSFAAASSPARSAQCQCSGNRCRCVVQQTRTLADGSTDRSRRPPTPEEAAIIKRRMAAIRAER